MPEVHGGKESNTTRVESPLEGLKDPGEPIFVCRPVFMFKVENCNFIKVARQRFQTMKKGLSFDEKKSSSNNIEIKSWNLMGLKRQNRMEDEKQMNIMIDKLPSKEALEKVFDVFVTFRKDDFKPTGSFPSIRNTGQTPYFGTILSKPLLRYDKMPRLTSHYGKGSGRHTKIPENGPNIRMRKLIPEYFLLPSRQKKLLRSLQKGQLKVPGNFEGEFDLGGSDPDTEGNDQYIREPIKDATIPKPHHGSIRALEDYVESSHTWNNFDQSPINSEQRVHKRMNNPMIYKWIPQQLNEKSGSSEIGYPFQAETQRANLVSFKGESGDPDRTSDYYGFIPPAP